MLFRVIDHYNFELNEYKENLDYDNQECFICYENENDNGEKPIKLNSSLYYTKKCGCNGFIHKSCLDIWYQKKNNCPICREVMFIKGDFNLKVGKLVFVFIVIKKNIINILRYLTVCFFVFFTCEFYLSIHYNVMKRDFYDDYNETNCNEFI